MMFGVGFGVWSGLVLDKRWGVERGGGGRWEMGDGRWEIGDDWLEIGDDWLEMGDGRWEMGDGRWEVGDGRWEMGDGRWEMGDGRWETGWLSDRKGEALCLGFCNWPLMGWWVLVRLVAFEVRCLVRGALPRR